MNFINIFDKILVDSGVSYSKNHDDFITSKVSAIDARQSTANEQDFFIHN
jgi:outer membrane protein assembly factor BamB